MSGFRAHLADISQRGWPALQYRPIPWQAVGYNGGYFDLATGIWTPPAGEVIFGGQVWISQLAWGEPKNFVAKIHKNGVGLIAGIGLEGTFPGSMVIPISGSDWASGKDAYQLQLYTTSDAIVDGNPAHTWWSGSVVGPVP